MADKAAEAVSFRNKVRAGDLAGVRQMLKDGVDFAGKAKTHGEWTPLHTACWGSAKPQNDREIVEAILMAAQKAVAARPEFRGTVAFVPTQRFWRDETVSPSRQGYHWNSNAETYYLIGDGMGRSMLELVRPGGGDPRFDAR